MMMKIRVKASGKIYLYPPTKIEFCSYQGGIEIRIPEYGDRFWIEHQHPELVMGRLLRRLLEDELRVDEEISSPC